MTRTLTLILTLALLLATQVYAADRFSCLPSPVGTGTKAVVKSTPKGDFAAWYCPGESLPNMAVCLKSTCGLVGMKRALAMFASDPSLDNLNSAMAPYTRNPLLDPDLVSVWAPYADEIRKSGGQ